MTTTVAYDAISANVSTMPAGQHCGYVTGSSAIQWSSAQFVDDPAAVRIDQSPVNTNLDETADVLDVESGAATLGDIAPWVEAARRNFNSAARPGQRQPMVYCSPNTLQPAVDALTAAGVKDVPFWIAKPGTSLASAQAGINSATGPYPLWGVQYNWGNTYDADVFLSSWLTHVSGKSGDTIYAGDYGPAVQAAQERINIWAASAKLPQLAVDGCFGPNTLIAIQAFQAFKGLVSDGIVGPKTWAALNENPDPHPVPEPFPAPKNFKYEYIHLDLVWDAVPPVNGVHPTGYSVEVVLAGKPLGTKMVPSTSTSVVLAVGKSYEIKVWANGGPGAPGVATLNVTV